MNLFIFNFSTLGRCYVIRPCQ